MWGFGSSFLSEALHILLRLVSSDHTDLLALKHETYGEGRLLIVEHCRQLFPEVVDDVGDFHVLGHLQIFIGINGVEIASEWLFWGRPGLGR